jgi:ribonuclease P protein component
VNVSGVATENCREVPNPRKHAAFPRSARLLKRGDFESVYKRGKRCFAADLTLFYLLRIEGSGPRVGFTVGRALGGAVDRNRIKRRLREAVRLHRRELNCAVDMVINPKKSVLTVDFTDLEREIQHAFAAVQKAAGKRA